MHKRRFFLLEQGVTLKILIEAGCHLGNRLENYTSQAKVIHK